MKKAIILICFVLGILPMIYAQTTTLDGGDFKIIYMGINSYSSYSKAVILLHEIYDGTLINKNYAVGEIYAFRGSTGSNNRTNVASVNTSSAYNQTYGSVVSTNSDGKWILKTTVYEGKKYMAALIPYRPDNHNFAFQFMGRTGSTGENMKLIIYEDEGVIINSEVSGSLETYTPNMNEYHDVSIFNISGKLGVGTASPEAKIDIYETSLLGSSIGSNLLLQRISGKTYNKIMNNQWLLRDANGSDWYTARLHDGISVDASFLEPGIDTRTWWERDPYNNIQSWGNGNSTYLVINNGRVGIGTNTPSYALHIKSTSNTYVTSETSSTTEASLFNLGTNNATQAAYMIAYSSGHSSQANQLSFKNLYGDITFHTKSAGLINEKLRITSDGNLGIGTTIPLATRETGSIATKLHVYNSATSGKRQELAKFEAQGDADNVSALVRINHANDRGLFLEGGRAIGDKSFGKIGIIETNGTLTDVMYIDDAGNTGFGTTSIPENYKLAVAGKILAEEIQVSASGTSPWPDFVFASDYQLKTLKEVECFIKEKQHLPDVPSAEEIAEEGISLGEMNALLLQKIEELTLYAIEQDKRIKIQDDLIIKELESNKSLENRIEKLELIISQSNK